MWSYSVRIVDFPILGILITSVAVLSLNPAEAEFPGPFPQKIDEQSSEATGGVLYFVSGSPTTNVPLRFPVRLYRLSEESLDPVRTIVAKDVGVEYIFAYPDERVLVAAESGPEQPERKIDVLWMSRPWEQESFILKVPHGFLTGPHLFRDGRRLLFAVRLYDSKESLPPRGFDLEDGKPVTLTWDIYPHVCVSGAPGPFFPGDWLYLVQPQDGQARTLQRMGSVKMGWPDNRLLGPSKVELLAWVINDSMVAMNLMGPAISESRDLYVLNKRSSQWTKVQFPGGLSKFRAFGAWLVGYEAYSRKDVSPGFDQRRQKETETGYPLDWQLSANNVYLPGRLFLYNVDTHQRFEIQTEQGDSEVLLVDNAKLIYRINRTIMSTRIGADEVEAPRKIAESDVVPDIHWAFFGPPKPEAEP